MQHNVVCTFAFHCTTRVTAHGFSYLSHPAVEIINKSEVLKKKPETKQNIEIQPQQVATHDSGGTRINLSNKSLILTPFLLLFHHRFATKKTKVIMFCIVKTKVTNTNNFKD